MSQEKRKKKKEVRKIKGRMKSQVGAQGVRPEYRIN